MKIVKVNNNTIAEKYHIDTNIATKSDIDFDSSLEIAKRAQATMTIDAMIQDGKTKQLDMSTVQQIFGVKQNYAKTITPVVVGSGSQTTSTTGTASSPVSSGQTTVARSLNASTKQTLDSISGSSYAYGTLTVPDTYKSIFAEAAAKYGVDEKYLESIAMAESGFHPDATSPSGAMGIMQLMPYTATAYGVSNGYDPYQNIMGGAHLLSDLLKQYDGNYALATAAYNAGSGAVAASGGVPATQSTRNYVITVMDYYANR